MGHPDGARTHGTSGAKLIHRAFWDTFGDRLRDRLRTNHTNGD